jgi:hypothetical protein
MSNGRQIGTIVGSLVAAYFTAGTSYAALAVAAGGAAGGYIGGALDPEKTFGPRLDDLKVTVSTYGASIPRIYGTERAGGIVVWCTDRQEVVTTEDVGKGSGQENTSYNYYVHMRVLLCERPADGGLVNLVQIFQDGKLVWDASSGLSIGQALASEESPLSDAVLYQGEETQLPDPYEELFEGVGNAPAWRDFVSVSLRNIGCPGGRVPQFSFVFSAQATVGDQAEDFSENIGYAAQIMSDRVYSFSQSVNTMTIYLGGPGYFNLHRVATLPAGTFSYYPRPIQDAVDPLALRITTNGVNSYQFYTVNLESGSSSQVIDVVGVTTLPSFDHYGGAAYDQITAALVVAPDDVSQIIVCNSATSATGVVECDPISSGSIGAIAAYDSVVYALVGRSTTIRIDTFSQIDGTFLGSYDTGIIFATYQTLCRSTITATAAGIFLYLVDSNNEGNWLRFNGSSFEVLATDSFPGDEPWSQNGWGLGSLLSMYSDANRVIVGPTISSDMYKTIFNNRVTVTDVKVKDIIAAEMDRIGESRYSVAEIPDADVVTGFKIASQASTRAAIAPLTTAFQIFQVEEDGLIKFRKYDAIASTASIGFDELGYSADGNSDLMPLKRMQEVDLPRSVTVSYIQPGLDFNVSSESDARQTTESIEDQSVELAVAMSSDIAKRASQLILYAAWNAQNTRSSSFARKFAIQSPGDGVDIEYPRGTTALWRVTSANDDGRVIQWTLEPGDAELFGQTAVGSTDFSGQAMPDLAPPTVMEIIDGPILQDADNNAGLYVAMAGAGSDGWNGAELFAGNDDQSLQSQGTVRNEVIRGFAENALGDFSLNILDGLNTLTVNVGDGELTSATADEVGQDQSLNAFALGINGRWEYGQFVTATSLGNTGDGNRYRLSMLVRGSRGTGHNRSNHAANDHFVMLGYAGTLRPVFGNADIGQTKSYRAISQGRSFNSASSQTYANTAEGLMPFSPWDARKSLAASNNQTVVWERRSRLATNALRAIVPLGEASESYEVDFYTSSAFTTVAGTLSATTKSLTITSAQQTSFGLTPGATLYVRIYQLSDVVGRGHYLQATL